MIILTVLILGLEPLFAEELKPIPVGKSRVDSFESRLTCTDRGQGPLTNLDEYYSRVVAPRCIQLSSVICDPAYLEQMDQKRLSDLSNALVKAKSAIKEEEEQRIQVAAQKRAEQEKATRAALAKLPIDQRGFQYGVYGFGSNPYASGYGPMWSLSDYANKQMGDLRQLTTKLEQYGPQNPAEVSRALQVGLPEIQSAAYHLHILKDLQSGPTGDMNGLEVITSKDWFDRRARAELEQRQGLGGYIFMNFGSGDMSTTLNLINYRETCGESGLSENAFYDPSIKKIVLCPGLLISSTNTSARQFTVAHEAGHAVLKQTSDLDTRAFDSCLDQNYADQLPGPARGLHEEMLADMIGIETVSKKMEDAHFSERQTIDYLRENLAFMCNNPGGRGHPPTDFRIDVTIGQHPRIRKLLGCQPPTEELPFCGLDGAQYQK